MKIVDPVPFMGIASGMEVLRLNDAEKATLMRAVVILEKAHDLVDARDPDHQGENDELSDALCLAPPAIRHFVEDGISV